MNIISQLDYRTLFVAALLTHRPRNCGGGRNTQLGEFALPESAEGRQTFHMWFGSVD